PTTVVPQRVQLPVGARVEHVHLTGVGRHHRGSTGRTCDQRTGATPAAVVPHGVEGPVLYIEEVNLTGTGRHDRAGGCRPRFVDETPLACTHRRPSAVADHATCIGRSLCCPPADADTVGLNTPSLEAEGPSRVAIEAEVDVHSSPLSTATAHTVRRVLGHVTYEGTLCYDGAIDVRHV